MVADERIGQVESLIDTMKECDLKKKLNEIQDLIVRNSFIVNEMETMDLSGSGREGLSEMNQKRALYTQELRTNIILTTRLTAELQIAPKDVGPISE